MFLGAPQRETHTTTHPDGSQSTTVVVRDSPWDEDSREAAYALYDDKADRCPQCGRPLEECQNEAADWFPQLTYCWRTASEQVANREWLAKHEKAKANEAGYLPTDGARVFTTPVDLGLGGDFLAHEDDGDAVLMAAAEMFGGDHDGYTP